MNALWWPEAIAPITVVALAAECLHTAVCLGVSRGDQASALRVTGSTLATRVQWTVRSGGVSIRESNGLLKTQQTFLAHLDGAVSGPVQVNNEVDDQGDEYDEDECREGYPMPGNSRCIAKSGCCHDDRREHQEKHDFRYMSI